MKYGKVAIPCKYKAKDLWLWDEEKAILAYLAEPELQDAHAVDQMSKGIITDTYRPCFASLVCKKIRGRLRVYVHITVEGKAISKKKKRQHTKDITMEKEILDVISERRQSPTLPIPKWDLKIWQKEEIQFSMWKDRRL